MDAVFLKSLYLSNSGIEVPNWHNGFPQAVLRAAQSQLH